VAWLLFLSLAFVGWAVALSELVAAFALHGGGSSAPHDATLAATIGTVAACAVIAAHFKHRALCWAAAVLWYGCGCGRIVVVSTAAAADAEPLPATAPGGDAASTPVSPGGGGGGGGAAAADVAQLPV
jgi:hypothetical protein